MRVIAVVMWLSLAGAAAAAAAPSTAEAAQPCRRYAATPDRVPSGDDNRPDAIHAAGGAVSCPNDVWVQVTACVQLESAAGWDDVGCATSPRTHITQNTRGGRGQGVSFDVPCVSGAMRTHVTGGEGLEPYEWDSETIVIACGVHDVPVDTTPPSTSIVSGPSDLTAEPSPSFGFRSSEAGSTFECRLDAPRWSACASPTAYDVLPDGEYTFRVRATDPAGNLGAEATRTFTVDTTPPETLIESGPSGTVADADARLVFASDPAASFACRLDAAAWTACTSPVTYAGLAAGEHSFRVRATDAAGNSGAETVRTWNVVVAAASGPADATGAGSARTPSGAAPPAVVPAVAGLDTAAPRMPVPAHRRALAVSRAGVVRVSLGPFPQDASGRLELRANVRRLGGASFTAHAGRAIVVRVKLRRSGMSALRRRGRLAVRATVTLRDVAGNTSATELAFALELARASSRPRSAAGLYAVLADTPT